MDALLRVERQFYAAIRAQFRTVSGHRIRLVVILVLRAFEQVRPGWLFVLELRSIVARIGRPLDLLFFLD